MGLLKQRKIKRRKRRINLVIEIDMEIIILNLRF